MSGTSRGALVLLVLGLGAGLGAAMLAAQTPRPSANAQRRAPEPPGFADRHETEHFVILAREGEATAAELQWTGERAEGWFEALRGAVGEDRTPRVKLLVMLDGSGLDGSNIPHVDGQGRIFLYQYTDEFADYLDALLHEMVHAFRRTAGRPYLGFAEEGVAAAIDEALFPDKVSFPLFGYSSDLVAGHLFTIDRAIPLEVLRTGHRTINLACQLQSYSERASFFGHLRDTFGLAALIDFIYDPAGVDPAGYEHAFGQTFSELVHTWEAVLSQRYGAIEDADAQWAAYIGESPARYQNICEPGKDYSVVG